MTTKSNDKVSKAHRDMLERIRHMQDRDNSKAIHDSDRGPSRLMALQITANGGREVTKLRSIINLGLVKVVKHPQLAGVEALEITDAGRAALSS